MKSKRIIGFTLAFVLFFLLIGLNTASASHDEVINNLSDSLESNLASNVDLGASNSIESSHANADSDVSNSLESSQTNEDLGISNSIE